MLRGLSHVPHRSVRRWHLYGVDGTSRSPEKPPRGSRLALETEGDEGRRQELVCALDAEAAAVTTGAAGVPPETVVADAHEAEPRLHDFRRVVACGGPSEDDHRDRKSVV